MDRSPDEVHLVEALTLSRCSRPVTRIISINSDQVIFQLTSFPTDLLHLPYHCILVP